MTMTKAAVLLLFISCLYMFAFSSSSVTMVSGSNTRRMESVNYGGGGYGGGGYGGGGYGGSHGGGGSGYAGGDDEGAHHRHGGSHDRGDDHGGDYSDRDGNDRHATNGSEQLFFMSALVIMVSMSVAISLGYV